MKEGLFVLGFPGSINLKIRTYLNNSCLFLMDFRQDEDVSTPNEMNCL